MRLTRYRQGSLLAVAMAALLIMIFEAQGQSEQMATESVQQATSTLRELLLSFYSLAPKVLIVIAVLFFFWLLSKLIHTLYRKIAHRSQKGASIVALTQIGLFFLAIIIAVSVLAGDIRALLGSIGLIGLALSWALQTPIESFTGWVLNTFRSYYRIGDRIEVGEAFGDVYKIDFLTTTIWEAGGPGKPVAGAQPTGALITFPNSEVLRSNIVNYSRDFPFVWDEVTFGLANESDLSYALNVIRKKAEEVLGEQMALSIQEYRRLLIHQGLDYDIEDKPQVYLSLTDSWTNCTVRYLVAVRARRRWSSQLIEDVSHELSAERHKSRIRTAYPRQETYLRVETPTPPG